MKKVEASFCSNCDWSGDAMGLADCPVCGATLARLDSFDEEEDKYPDDLLEVHGKETDLIE